MIAKRRGYAVLISHAVPPFTTADLYEGYVDLERMIEEYGEARIFGRLKGLRNLKKINT